MATTTNDIFNTLGAFLDNAGLSSLFSVDSNGNPSGWLWDQITKGIDTQDELVVAIESTDAFKQRYPAIVSLRQRAAAGEPVMVPTVGQVREYEDTVSRTMRQAGLPTWFYDHYTDMQDLMSKGLSPTEVEARLGNAWDMVQNTDPAIRQTFDSFYGVAGGTAALAAWYLDADKTQAQIERASRAAYTAGMGSTMGLDVSQATAERVAGAPKTEAGIYQDLTDAARMSPLYTEGITETSNLTADQGLAATSLGDAASRQKLQDRALERQANDRSAFGGALATQQGTVGLRDA